MAAPQDSPDARPLRVGSVPYAVARPLDRGLEGTPGVHYRREVPARLVELLRAGELDVALVSSIELFRRPGYQYLSGLGVCGRGAVGSVQVFLRKPIGEIASLALDPDSRTAAALVRTLLEGSDGSGPRWLEVTRGEDPAAAGADAWLRIGDVALREHLAPGSPPVFNPSQEWTRRTGLPFVFAVWIARPELDLASAGETLWAARRRGARDMGRIAEESADTMGVSREAAARYLLEECVYEPGPDMHRALLRFRDGAAARGLCDAELQPRAVEPTRGGSFPGTAESGQRGGQRVP